MQLAQSGPVECEGTHFISSEFHIGKLLLEQSNTEINVDCGRVGLGTAQGHYDAAVLLRDSPTAVVFGTEQATFRYRPVPSLPRQPRSSFWFFFGQRIPRTPSKPKDNVEFDFVAVDPARG
jgi:hypothetical protein